MRFYKASYWAYAAVRTVLRKTGTVRRIRPYLGAAGVHFVQRTSGNMERPLPVRGHQMYLAAPGYNVAADMVGDRYEIDTTRVFERLVKPGNVVLDIGANVGYFSLLSARLVGSQGKVYAFEPEPNNYGLIIKNMDLNGYSNISPVNKAISNAAGTAQLRRSDINSGNHSLYDLSLSQIDTVDIETTTLDEFLKQEGWPKVDFVKIDIEGSEMDAFQGMESFFQRSKNLHMVVEFCPWIMETLGQEPYSLIEKLSSLGFSISEINKKSTTPLDQVDYQKLIHRLRVKDGYTNLLCSKGEPS